VLVRPAAGRLSKKEIDDLPKLESLTTGYLSDESEAVATVVQSDTQCLLGSKCADPHPPGLGS